MPRLNINGKSYDVDVEPETPLLWAIRDNVGLTGTKYGCGVAQCGACTVYVDGQTVRSCSLPVSASRHVSPEKLVGCSSKFSTLKTSGPFFSLSAKASSSSGSACNAFHFSSRSANDSQANK